MESAAATKPDRPQITPERWDKIKKIFDSLIGMPEHVRPAALRRQCAGDSLLEEEIRQLLATYERTAISVELAAAAALSYVSSREPAPVLRDGDFIAGRFGIIRFINSGGMGEVYEAWDSELQDLVALKTIRHQIAAIPTIIERFKQEVKRSRAISHPNVCRVYDLFSHDLKDGERLWFLTMELLVGDTLFDRLRKHGLFTPVEALPLVEQMVAGLAAAHDLGIVHRDFKSSNVMLVPGPGNRTRAVINDFGLSIAISADGSGGRQVARGGTPAYMAPEQESGGKISLATDQYALGVVVCEMLSGQRPKWSAADQNGHKLQLPDKARLPKWETVIRRCLEQLPEARFKNVREINSLLNPERSRFRAKMWASVAAVCALVAVAIAMRPGGTQPRLQKLSELTPDTDFSTTPSISRDGKVIAYSSDRAQAGNLDIWLQRVPGGAPTRITTDPAEDKYPSIAPDGSSIVFRSERNGGGVYLANSSGTVQRLLVPGGRNPQFSPDGRRIVYWVGDKDESTPSGKLYLLSLEGKVPMPIAPDFVDARWPVWSSDGTQVLFYGCRERSQPMPTCVDWWTTSVDGKTVQNTGALALLRRQQVEPLQELGGWYGDDVLFTGKRAGKLSIWKLRVSKRTLKADGVPQLLSAGVNNDVDPSLAQDGTLIFAHLSAAVHIWRIDHPGRPEAAESTRVTQDAGTDSDPSISSDGRWLFFSRQLGTVRGLWKKDTVSGTETIVHAMGRDLISPAADNSGELFAFETTDGESPSIYIAASTESAKKLCTRCSKPTGWFDGNRAVFYRAGSPSRIEMADPRTGILDTVVENRDFSLSDANWSPETEYLVFTAYRENETKRVFAVKFPKTLAKATGRWIPISEASVWSDRPKWSADGKTVFFLSTRDGFSCIWGEHFDPRAGHIVGPPFAVMHYHNLRLSPARIAPQWFDLSVAGDSIYLNVGEETASLWTGLLRSPRLFWALPF